MRAFLYFASGLINLQRYPRQAERLLLWCAGIIIDPIIWLVDLLTEGRRQR